MRRVHAAVAWLWVLAIVAQVFLAGAAIPQLGGVGGFATHVDFGYSIGIVVLAILVTAVLAKAGRRAILISAGLLVLYVVQTSLPYAKEQIPSVAAFHPVNALLLFAASIWYARHAWQASTATSPV